MPGLSMQTSTPLLSSCSVLLCSALREGTLLAVHESRALTVATGVLRGNDPERCFFPTIERCKPLLVYVTNLTLSLYLSPQSTERCVCAHVNTPASTTFMTSYSPV